jgi:hypothetical protein
MTKFIRNQFAHNCLLVMMTLLLFCTFSMENINRGFSYMFCIFVLFGMSGWAYKNFVYEKSSRFFCSLFLCLLLSDFFKFSKTPLMASILNPIDSFCATANHYIFAIGTVALVAKTCIDFLKWKRRKEGGGKG